MAYAKNDQPLQGTVFFDGDMARKAYGLNKMCYSFNNIEAREAFLASPEAYCDKFKLTAEQKQAVLDKDILKLLDLGGSIYYLAKLVGIFGMNMQDIGAIQTGMTVEEFKQKLIKAGQ